jgi:hypothetical protein
MTLEALPQDFSVCKLAETTDIPDDGFLFLARTDREVSLVCEACFAPANAVALESGWRALRVRGELDFGLVGILAELSGILAAAGISIFAISTFDTDYVLVKGESFGAAVEALRGEGHVVEIISLR